MANILPFPKSVMQQIATYYVLLHKTASLHNESIKVMNNILGNKSSINVQQSLPLQSIQPILAKCEVISEKVLIPVIKNLT